MHKVDAKQGEEIVVEMQYEVPDEEELVQMLNSKYALDRLIF